jgi:nucleotide-binding universal stress UspA family protein
MIKRILVPTDFSEPSLAAIRYGLDLAETVSGEIVLLHVVEEKPVQSYTVGGPPPFFSVDFAPGRGLSLWPEPQRIIQRDLCEEANWKLAALFPPSSQKRVRTVVTAGKPASEIVRVARERDADLIILGSRGRRGLRRLLRRTIADKVRRKAPIPVIAVDADHLSIEGTPGGNGAPYQSVAGGHADLQRDKRVLSAKDLSRSCSRPEVSTSSSPEGAERSAADPVLPPLAPFRTRVGQHGTKRARPINR